MVWVPPTGGEVDEWTSKLIKERDKYRCLRCGKKDRLSIHHLRPRSNNLNESQDYDNLATLCIECHCWVHDIATRKEKEDFTLRTLREIKDKML